jgi:hypothetical protein
MTDDPATKQDIEAAIEAAERRLEKKLDELKAWIAYFAITLGAMYFIASRVH